MVALLWRSPAEARQGAPSDDAAGADATPAAPPAPPPLSPMIAPAATSSATNDRPARGPSMRERGGRRSRAGGTASGVLFLVILVGAMAWYVVKKLRR